MLDLSGNLSHNMYRGSWYLSRSRLEIALALDGKQSIGCSEMQDITLYDVEKVDVNSADDYE